MLIIHESRLCVCINKVLRSNLNLEVYFDPIIQFAKFEYALQNLIHCRLLYTN